MEPHYFAGVTGAHKTLTVGVMSLNSLTANHRHALAPVAQALRLEGNPVHDDIVRTIAALERTGARLFAVNQLIVDRRLVGCTAGHPLDALQRGLPMVRQAYGRRVPTGADVVIARVGPPLDRDLYQADKGIKNTEAAVVDGGVLILEAACDRGVGLDDFLEVLRRAPTHAAALALVRSRGYRLGDHKAVRLRALTDVRRVRVGIVAGSIDPTLAPALGIAVFADRAAAATWVRRRLAPNRARGLLIEDAGNVVLTVA